MIFKKPITDAESTARYIMYQVKNGVPIKAVLKNLGYEKAEDMNKKELKEQLEVMEVLYKRHPDDYRTVQDVRVHRRK